MLEADDPADLAAWRVALERATEVVQRRDQNLAVLIANAVGKLFPKR